MGELFKKIEPSIARAVKIPGTRPSIRNCQLLTSTGVHSLDALLGGGIAVGTLVLIEEDAFASYSNVLSRYFLAEGVASRQKLFVASLARTPDGILKSLPCPVSEDEVRRESANASADSLKIAWQYRHLPAGGIPSTAAPQLGRHYDLCQSMDSGVVGAATHGTFGLAETQPDGRSEYDRLLHSILSAARQPAHATTAPLTPDSKVLRVLLQSLGSSLWQSGTSSVELCSFLYKLRAVLRYTLGVCFVTIPMHAFQDASMALRIEYMCDTVLSLESFEGSSKKTNPIFKDYQGLLHVVKLPCLNSLMGHHPLSQDFGFKLRRRKLVFETLHLPPELSETAGRGREEFDARSGNSSVGCGSSLRTKNLDF